MGKPIPEQLLITSFNGGEESALEYYYKLHFRTLVYYSQRLTRNKQEAEDIVAEVFSRLWKMRENFNSSTNIRAFLYISVRNASINYLAYLKRLTNVKDGLLYIAEENEEAPDFTALEIEAAVLQQVYEEIEKLPNRCREIFKLSYFEGMTNDQIAEKLQLSIYTIANQKQRAMAILRTTLVKGPLLKTIGLLHLAGALLPFLIPAQV